MLLLKKIFFFLISFTIFLTLQASAETAKVVSLTFDDYSSIILIHTEGNPDLQIPKYSKLDNPNRIYFDIDNAVLVGPKQQFGFENSPIKEVRLAQFSTNPETVRTVITFDESFDTSNIKLINVNGCIIIKLTHPTLQNDYFTAIYDEFPIEPTYSNIVASSQIIQKNNINLNIQNNEAQNIINDIQKSFSDSTIGNSDGKTYDSVVSVDISSDLKLRTKYYINGYYLKNNGLLVSGLGQITAAKMFTLDSPKRVVIDLPNSYVDKKIRNKDLKLCSDGTCTDTAKIGQFEHNKARIVVTTPTPEKYLPIYSADSQSMLFINGDKLNHTNLVSNIANINNGYVNKIDSKTNELILSFNSPVVSSVIKNEKSLILYFFNVKSYNEPDLMKIFSGTFYKNLTLSLLPQIGVKAELKLKKDDKIKILQSADGKAIKFIITTEKDISPVESLLTDTTTDIIKKLPIKNKIVLDPGHGGTDYGAIRDGINEKDITLDITERVEHILKSKGYKVALTRTDDLYLSLQDRVDFSENENPEIFVSIHVNSAVATEPYGIETHYYHDYSKELATVIQKHMMKNISSKDRGILKSKFYVINHTTVPAVLVETGFLSNTDERAELITESRKQKTAKAIADGIIEYLKKNK